MKYFKLNKDGTKTPAQPEELEDALIVNLILRKLKKESIKTVRKILAIETSCNHYICYSESCDFRVYCAMCGKVVGYM